MRVATTLLIVGLLSNSLWAEDHGYSFPPVSELPVSDFLPDPFIMEDGSRVKTRADWEKQRAYLKAMIQHYLFGFRPPAPKNVDVQVSGPSTNRTLKFTINAPSGKSFSFDAGMFVPPGDGPFPVVIRNDRSAVPSQTEMAAKRGYIMISYNRTQLDEDQLAATSNSNNRFPAQEAYPDYSWETIMCWSWGYTVIIDWLETQKYVDTKGIVVTGHSRGGKTALIGGIMDERIALTVPNGSGAGGSGNFRFGDFGGAYQETGIAESLGQITRSFPYWFAPELNSFRGQETRLPFDLHTVKALVAPRGLLSTDGTEDWWANPKNSQRTTEAAKEVYRFLGVPEKIGHHFRDGGHAQNAEDWEALFDFADFIIKGKPLPENFYAKNYPAGNTQWKWKAPIPLSGKTAHVATNLAGAYLGQTPPGMSVAMFAPEIISTAENYELNSVFSPKGDEFIFTRGTASIGSGNIMIMKRVNNTWTEPEVISFCRDYPGVDPSMSPDGNTIFYASGRPLNGTGEARKDYDLWMAFRDGDGWSEPVHLGPEVNTGGRELYPVFTAKNHLFWRADRPGSLGGGDIWRATLRDGKFTEIINVGPAINTSGDEGDVYVSPEEDYLIVVSARDGRGLYISFKQEGKWTTAINMGTAINKDKGEFCPMVSPDGKYFFFTAKNKGKGDIYWISADYLETLRSRAKSQVSG